MDFNLELRYSELRKRLNEDYEKIKKIENLYPFYFVFLSFVGFYYFEFVSVFAEIEKYTRTDSQIILYSLFSVVFCLSTYKVIKSLILFWQIIKPVEIHHEALPINVFKVYAEIFQEQNNNAVAAREETLKELVKGLEKGVIQNYKIYKEKRKKAEDAIKVLTTVFIFYLATVFLYRILILW